MLENLRRLAVHELATNSTEYGALSVSEGRVVIGWRVVTNQDTSNIVVTWREVGGPPVEAPKSKGFGSILLQNLIGQDVGGHSAVKYRRSGVVWQAVIASTFFKGEQH